MISIPDPPTVEQARQSLRKAGARSADARTRLRAALVEALAAEIDEAWAWRDLLLAQNASTKQVREMEARSVFLTQRQQAATQLVNKVLDARRWARFLG